MLPSLHPGDWVLASAVERIDYVNPNRMYVVILDDAVLVKKIMQKPLSNNITLISTNEKVILRTRNKSLQYSGNMGG